MIERLPTPWGLVRLGVAPDHPKIKSVSRAFEKIAAQPGLSLLRQRRGRARPPARRARRALRRRDLRGRRPDRPAHGDPRRGPAGLVAATEFVAWYNGHPDYQHLEFDLSGERAVVIGNGNVAVDVARMLALTPEELAPTDTTDAAIEAFNDAGIREIVMVGRRGPAQAAFTNPELLELGELAGADVIVDPADLEGARADGHELRAEPRGAARVRGARAGGQAEAPRAALPASRRSRSRATSGSRRSSSSATGSSRTSDGSLRAVADGERETLPRPRLPERRLPRRRASGRPVRRAPRHDPERRAAASTPRRATSPAGSSAARAA